VILFMPFQAGAALLAWARRPLKQRSIEIFHVAMLLVFGCCCITMIHVQAGGIYFWLKDISPVFLKIHAVYNALDILNKVRACRASVGVIGWVEFVSGCVLLQTSCASIQS
jgi:hypothetical protein